MENVRVVLREVSEEVLIWQAIAPNTIVVTVECNEPTETNWVRVNQNYGSAVVTYMRMSATLETAKRIVSLVSEGETIYNGKEYEWLR